MTNKYVYEFGDGRADGNATMRMLLGGKGANLAEMTNLKLPVPPGFTITTDVCHQFYDNNKQLPLGLLPEIQSAIARVEQRTARQFNNPDNPLLVSIRSGAPSSMPGMMDTVLNLGICSKTVDGLARQANDMRFAYDTYRRFIQMYSSVVLNIGHDIFEDALYNTKLGAGIESDTELTARDLEELIDRYLLIVEDATGNPFPDDPIAQLHGAISAVFMSWNSPRAITYRQMHDIPGDWGTAVNVQAMVFGNMGDDCATGVAFTRDPSTGQNCFYGEYLINAQGEDVVAGIRTPQSLSEAARIQLGSDAPALETSMPDLYAQLQDVRATLESHYSDMQDIEFTIESGKLYLLQTRNGKRTLNAALKIACDMVDEGLITKNEAIMRINPQSLDSLLHPLLDPDATMTVIAQGLPASPGAASGLISFDANEAELMTANGDPVILVRNETSPEDIHGMNAAQGIVTARGGMTSHAAVVARGMGRPCVAGASRLRIDFADRTLSVDNHVLNAGDWLTINGTSGQIIAGRIPTIKPELSEDFKKLMIWADAVRRMKVRTNAETPDEIRTARNFGAEGIGLCRTEHMFFDSQRIKTMREMILADTTEGRKAALDKIQPMQREDFIDIFSAMAGFPVTIRLLDPPLHEFLPNTPEELADMAEAMDLPLKTVKRRARELFEQNPMLGHRGCRLLNSYPEICEMQATAIFQAATQILQKTNKPVICEIMIPLVSIAQELMQLRDLVIKVAKSIEEKTGVTVPYSIGTMIELPRAALQAATIAKHADFFSFGTNDLTQTTFGISRDDSSAFLPTYQRNGIFDFDPFARLDNDGVGELIKIACERGRTTRKDIKLGICGEHGGDPASIQFCDTLGIDYVSCSPYRVPIARLSAAQATIAAQEIAAQDK